VEDLGEVEVEGEWAVGERRISALATAHLLHHGASGLLSTTTGLTRDRRFAEHV
jgi:hypothetical protein